ncbi:MAG: beta-ketoacyl synthase N-terminal-like domain-containing protein, partial [Anaerolineaceae bacterium]|nr:beta-ketoacyl synthase N-terminal-like domain-containing protein [Anaerolineaceae bacterium]
MKTKAPQPVHHQINGIQTTPVAIIGMASIFPQANTVEEYWDNIVKKVDCVVDVPPSRWSIDDYYDPNPAAPDKSYCKRGGFIPDIDFDPLEFGLPPNILEVTDVTQLLSLIVARDALEDAGFNSSHDFDHAMTGVVLGFVGVGSKLYNPLMTRLQYPVWEKVLRSYGIADQDVQGIVDRIKLAYAAWEENAFPGTIGNVIAGRIANRFDLGAVNCVV